MNICEKFQRDDPDKLVAEQNNVRYKSQLIQAPVAQLDRVSDYESAGRTFESCRAHQKTARVSVNQTETLFLSLLAHIFHIDIM